MENIYILEDCIDLAVIKEDHTSETSIRSSLKCTFVVLVAVVKILFYDHNNLPPPMKKINFKIDKHCGNIALIMLINLGG